MNRLPMTERITVRQLSPWSGTTPHPAGLYSLLTEHGFMPVHPRARRGSEVGWLRNDDEHLFVTVYESGLILVCETDGDYCPIHAMAARVQAEEVTL